MCILGLGIGFVSSYQSPFSNDTSIKQTVTQGNWFTTFSDEHHVSEDEDKLTAHGNWTHFVYTVDELYDVADVIVCGRVTSTHNRLLTETLPTYGLPDDLAERAKEVPQYILTLEQGMRERGMEGSPDDLTQEQKLEILSGTTLEKKIISEETSHVPFMDTTFEVTEVLKGDAGKELMVTQIGGEMPAPGLGNEEGTHMTNLEFPEKSCVSSGRGICIVPQAWKKRGWRNKYAGPSVI